MPTVGRALAEERIRQGLTLEDIAASTRISRRFLQAIESDDFSQLPGQTFARAFVRQYAGALQLDGEGAVAQFHRERAIPEPRFTAAGQSAARFSVPRIRERPAALLQRNAFGAFLTFLLTIGICAGAFWAYSYFRSRPKPASVGVETRKVAQPRPQPPSTPGPQPVPAAQLHASITASEACWVRITSDGGTIFAGTMNSGESRDIDGQNEIGVRAGNAGALSVRLNGKDLPAMGPAGQVRVLTITLSGATVRAPDEANRPLAAQERAPTPDPPR